MVVIEVALVTNELADLLDRWDQPGRGKTAPGREERRRLLERAIALSLRGLALLSSDEMFREPAAYMGRLDEQFRRSPWEAAREVHQDLTTLRLFLAAERRLLRDLGLSDAALDRLQGPLEAALDAVLGGRGSEADLRGLPEALEAARGQLAQELSRLSGEDRHDQVWDRIRRIFDVLGGALVVVGDVAVVAPTAPVTGGLSAAGAALSVAVGVQAVKTGLESATPRG